MKKADLALYKRENPCYNLSCSGPVVQSVSTPACHAGGRRFESVPGRQKRGTILWMVPLFWANRGGLERLNPPLLWRGGQRVRAPLPPYGLPCSPQRVPSGSPCLLIQQNVYNHRERNTTRAHRVWQCALVSLITYSSSRISFLGLAPMDFFTTWPFWKTSKVGMLAIR